MRSLGTKQQGEISKFELEALTSKKLKVDCYQKNSSHSEREDYCPHGDPLMEGYGKTVTQCGVDDACPLGFICNINIEKNTTACCQVS